MSFLTVSLATTKLTALHVSTILMSSFPPITPVSYVPLLSRTASPVLMSQLAPLVQETTFTSSMDRMSVPSVTLLSPTATSASLTLALCLLVSCVILASHTSPPTTVVML